MQDESRKGLRRIAEGLVGVWAVAWLIRLIRFTFEMWGDAQILSQNAQWLRKTAERVISFAFSPAGTAITFVIVGGYLLADSRLQRRHKAPITSGTPTVDVAPVQMPPLPLPRISTTSAEEERVFTDTAPTDLCNIFKTHLATQADALVAPYMGKWLCVTGKVHNVARHSFPQNSSWVVWVWFPNYEDRNAVQVMLTFKEKWKDRLEILTRNSRIRAVGRISCIDTLSVRLEDCELANS